MTLRFTTILSFAFLLLFPSVLCAQQTDETSSDVLLSLPEPPPGFAITTQPLRMDNRQVGIQVQVTKPQSGSKVFATVETGVDRSAQSARVEATKGYVNGLAEGLKNTGLEMTESNLPDIDSASFDKPLQVDMTFGTQDMQLYVRQFIFFTDKGYNVQIITADQEDLQMLTNWAKHIQPAEAVPAGQ